jgi:hypothetical protein
MEFRTGVVCAVSMLPAVAGFQAFRRGRISAFANTCAPTTRPRASSMRARATATRGALARHRQRLFKGERSLRVRV